MIDLLTYMVVVVVIFVTVNQVINYLWKRWKR